MKKNILNISNLFTLVNLFMGISSIFAVVGGSYKTAALFILIGMLFDFLDGYSAQLLNCQSDFGKQFDSLADLVTFGIAPVAVFYAANGSVFPLLAYAVCAVYVVSITYRLARYNLTQTDGYFEGLPSTFSGGFIAFLVIGFPSLLNNGFSFLILILLSILSASRIKYRRIKIVKFAQVSFAVAAIIGYIFLHKYLFLAVFISYLLFAPFVSVKECVPQD